MIMAGLTHGALQKAGVSTNASTISGLGKHAANQTVHAGVKAGVDLTLTGKVDLKSTTLAVAANTASAFIANHIGQWYKGSDGTAVEAIAHKALHAINAGGRGFLVGGEKGMAASAIGAVVAESIAETFQPTGGMDKLPASERPTYDPDETRKLHAAAQLAAGGIAYAIGMDANAINEAAFSAMHALTHNHGYTLTALNHTGVKTDVKDEIVDESVLKADAEANGVSPEEQALVRTKLQHLSNESLGKAPTAAELITEMPSTPEALEATQKSVIKGYVQKIAAANENIHQILREHPSPQTRISVMNTVKDFKMSHEALRYIAF